MDSELEDGGGRMQNRRRGCQRDRQRREESQIDDARPGTIPNQHDCGLHHERDQGKVNSQAPARLQEIQPTPRRTHGPQAQRQVGDPEERAGSAQCDRPPMPRPASDAPTHPAGDGGNGERGQECPNPGPVQIDNPDRSAEDSLSGRGCTHDDGQSRQHQAHPRGRGHRGGLYPRGRAPFPGLPALRMDEVGQYPAAVGTGVEPSGPPDRAGARTTRQHGDGRTAAWRAGCGRRLR